LVQEFLAGPAAGQFTDAVQWFYDPMAAPAFVDQLGESLTVYDCMDELSKFRCAPPNIARREAQLLAKADLVFTGGRKLFESKSRQNRNCHFYGCGVDCEHFGLARYAHTPTPPAMAVLQKPILGYFGVVDERLDYELISQLANANPNWSVAIIGPTLKVENDPLPQRPNLHWLGRQPYEDLPGFCKAFDVCIMPFALNESTEFINPTKALEYMATARPIVSTPVADVVRNFGEVITIGHTADEFINHCREALEQSKPAALQRGLQMARENSWDSIVAHLEEHVSDALKKKTAVSNL
jgi:glycosyltransferase involved in cell wall biosynthesis